jgi:phosphoglycolate phosphatase
MSSGADALLFDLDGTLADTAGDLMGTLNFILAGEGLAPLPIEDGRKLLGAGARALIARGFAQAGEPLADDRLQRLFEVFVARYNAHIADNSRLYPGVEAALELCARAGQRLAVCTNKLERSAHLLLGALGIAERFGFVCGQDTFGIAKPDPRPLLLTIAGIGGDPARSIMVGDSRTDVAAARAAGLPAILVDFGYSDTPVERLGADRVISHFDELAAAVAGIRGA